VRWVLLGYVTLTFLTPNPLDLAEYPYDKNFSLHIVDSGGKPVEIKILFLFLFFVQLETVREYNGGWITTNVATTPNEAKI